MTNKVRAFEEMLEFSEEQGHAVVVEFDKPWRFVFWDKAQYVGCVDLGDGVWFTPEWCETNSPNDLHCYEPIMDKQLRWSHVEILETGPARARVKWSYALCDMRYRIFHGNTRAEEIYTIYPDGVAVREIVLFPGTETNHGGNANFWQVGEWILINAKGTSPLDCLEMPSPFHMMNGSGDSVDVPWPLPPKGFDAFCHYYPQVADWKMYIGEIKLRDIPHPFMGIVKDQRLFPYVPCAACGGDHPDFNLFPGERLFNVYKHWPVVTFEDFIEWVPAGEDIGKVATHTSFVDTNFAMRRNPNDFIPTPPQGCTWYILVGATEQGAAPQELETLMNSYYHPANVSIHEAGAEAGISGDRFLPTELHRGALLYEGYDYSLRAYTFRITTGSDELAVTLKPSVPLVNPVFVVNGWRSPDAQVTVDGAVLSSEMYVTQISGHDLVLWVKGVFAEAARFDITGSRK